MDASITATNSWSFFLAFGAVIFGLLAFLWVLKRLSGQHSASHYLQVKSQLMLGPKEKVVIIEVENQWIITGITPHSMQTLAILPKPNLASEDTGGPSVQQKFTDIIQNFRRSSSGVDKNE